MGRPPGGVKRPFFHVYSSASASVSGGAGASASARASVSESRVIH